MIVGYRAVRSGGVVHVVPVDEPESVECCLCRAGACHRRVEREPGSLDLVVHEAAGQS